MSYSGERYDLPKGLMELLSRNSEGWLKHLEQEDSQPFQLKFLSKLIFEFDGSWQTLFR